MKWTSVISLEERASDAVGQLVAQVRERMDGAPDLLTVFSSRHHSASSADIPRLVHDAFPEAAIVGCSAYSVVGDGREEEERAALSITAARLPGVEIDIRSTAREPDWLDAIGRDETSVILVLVDSSTADADALVRSLDARYPSATKVGGFASGGLYPGANVLYCNGEALREGAVIVSLTGNIEIDTIVAQGCRPVGDPLIVARHSDNVILEFERGRPASVLEELYAQLPPEDQALIPRSLHVGLQMRERTDGVYRRGDFLVRPIMGIDPNSGALSLAERVGERDVVQFHLRDAKSSTEDLREWLAQYENTRAGATTEGALLFTCIGRGVGLFGTPNHDTSLFERAVGDVPVGGFFCAGEIGPVGDRTFVHGYTSTFAMFRPGGDG